MLAVGAGLGITVNADDVALTTPGTLTVSSTNNASGNHSHAVTSSSNPGANARLLASDASGYLQLVRAGAGVAPSYPLHSRNASGTQMRLDYDASNYSDFTVGSGGNLTVAPSGDFLFDPVGNDILPVTNYDLNLGALSKKYLTLHAAELWVETLVAQNTIATIGGRILVGPTTTLTRDLASSANTYSTIALVGSATTGTGTGTGISFVDAQYATGRSVASLAITKPTGTTTNDLLICAITVTITGSVTTLAGWTLLREVVRPGSSRMLVYYRVAGGAEGASYTWTLNDDGDSVAGAIACYRNVNTSTPINVSGFASTPFGDLNIARSITTTTSNTRLVFVGGIETYGGTTLTSTLPTGYTERIDQAASVGGSGVQQVVYFADAAFTGQGATGEVVSQMAENWEPVAGLIALTPANSNTSATVNVPAGISNGHTMLATATYSGGTLNPPGGWTLVTSQTGFAVYRRTAASEPASYAWSLNTTDSLAVSCVAYSNVDATNPIDAYGSTTSAGSGSITRRGSWSNAAAESLLTVTTSGVLENDVMVAVVGYWSALSITSVPSGWTLAATQPGSGSNTQSIAVYYKVAGASESNSYAWGISTYDNLCIAIGAYYNVDTSNPIAAIGTDLSAASTSAVAPSVTTDIQDTMLLAFFAPEGDGTTATTVTAPGSMTERTESTHVWRTIQYSDEAITASGATGTRTATLSLSRESTNATVALRPIYGPSSSMTAPSVTTSVATDRLVFLGGAIGTSTSATAPGSMTERANAGTGSATTYIADRSLSSAGATGTYTATLAASRTNSAALVALRPAPSNSGTIYVRHNQMSSGDVVYMEANGSIEFFRITSTYTTISGTEYSYTVQRDLDGTGTNTWYAGDAMFNTGQTGQGWIDLYSLYGIPRNGQTSTQRAGPTIVGNVRTSSIYNDFRERWAIGNLNGLYDYGSTIYGFAAGDPTAAWVSADATNGFRVMHAATTRVRVDTSGNATFGETAGVNPNMYYSSGALAIRSGTQKTIEFTPTGAINLIYRPTVTFGLPRSRINWYNESDEFLATMYSYTGGGNSYLQVEAYPQTASGEGAITLAARGATGASTLTLSASNARVSNSGLYVGAGSSAVASGAIYAEGIVSSIASGGGSLAGFRIEAAAPAYAWRETDQSADEKYWDAIANGKILAIRAVNDANSVAANAIAFTRGTGATISDTSIGSSLVATSIRTTTGNVPWLLGGYTTTAPGATGYVTVVINGTTYKLLAST